MKMTREEAADKVLKTLSAYYNISRAGQDKRPLLAVCEYYEHSQKYVLSRKAELWSADNEEFLYLFDVPVLTSETFAACRQYAYEDGMKRLHIGPGHMCSNITAVFLCEGCEKDARKALKKCRIYKSFHFLLHGWMNFHVAAVILNENRIENNYAGHTTAKFMKKILFRKKK